MALVELYKPTQGKYVRWGTVIAMGLIIGLGMYWMGTGVLEQYGMVVQSIGVVLYGAVGAVVTLLVVNRPRPAEFMIMTESEMRKVNWPSRLVVMNSTKVVIFMTFAIACLLGFVDWGFFSLFKWMGILTAAK